MVNPAVIGNEDDMLYFPYNSELDELGERDRLYDAADWRDNFALFIGNGVFPNPSNQLRVEAVGGKVLRLRAGNGWVSGGSFVLRRDFEFSLAPAHLTLPRRDVVILRHDVITRKTLPLYIPGVPASAPQPPVLVRTDDMFDLRLCEIMVGANAQAITQANILDTRPNNAVCGFVTGLVHTVDTTELFEQYWTFLQEQIALWEQRHDDQAEDWIGQMNQQQLDFDHHMDIMAEFYEQMRNLYLAIETQSFTLINNNFDDWSTKRSTDKTTEFLPNGNILERIAVVSNDFVLAEKRTEFMPNGDILESIVFHPWQIEEDAIGVRTVLTTEFTISKRTIFNVDGTITEVVR